MSMCVWARVRVRLLSLFFKGNERRKPEHMMQNSHRGVSRLKLITGSFLLLAGVVGVAYPLWWNHRSSSGATALLKSFRNQVSHNTTHPHQGTNASCNTSGVSGVLQIPSLSLVAPVEQGLADSVLNVAIGHDPATNWPGSSGTSLFAAHDVSFFSQLGSIQPGNLVTFTSGCSTLVYRVSGIKVQNTGTVISLPSVGSIILDTCYPSNALWYTNQRLVVTAVYVDQTKVVLPPVPTPIVSNANNLNAVVPTSIPPGELNLANNTQEMGHLTFSGSYSPSFVQSDLPLGVEATALKGWFAVTHSLYNSRPNWWSNFTQAIFPAQLVASNVRSTAPLEIDEQVTGTNVTGVTLSGGVNNFLLTVSEKVNGSQLVVSNISWS